jgi:hypothetical protein
MGYFKDWIVKDNSSPKKEIIQKKTQNDSSQNDQEKVIKNCPIFISDIQKSNIKEDTKEKIIQNCFMKKKDNFKVEKIDSTPSSPKKYVYTDGACIHNGKKYAKAGIGIFFGLGDKRNVSERISGKQTNNAAELEAILRVFKILEKEIKKCAAEFLSSIMPSTTLDANLDLQFLSHDQTVIEAYKKDPLVHGKISFQMGLNLFNLGAALIQKAHLLTVPIFMIHGDADGIVDCEGTKEFFSKLTTPNKEIKIYPGLFHEMMNELPKDKEIVLRDIKNFILSLA